MEQEIVKWEKGDMVEVTLKDDESFNVIKETLTRIGIASKKAKILYQSCHILHKKGRYYIVHFKELFGLDGKKSNITENDIGRRNAIIKLLEEWELIKIIDVDKIQFCVPIRQLKILQHKEKVDWDLQPKYNIGNSSKNIYDGS